MKKPSYLDRVRVPPDDKVRLKDYDPAWIPVDEFKELSKDELKSHARELLDSDRQQLDAAQERLYADDRYAILVVLQAMDAAGKDGTIKHVMSGLNPQGCEVTSFKQPSREELEHNFLWRYSKAVPERGRIGIFNRSYYEEVLVVKVHPELLVPQKLPEGKRGKSFWKSRYDDINAFERHLVRNGVVILKFFLHLSKEEQKRRFLARLDEPDKRWKFSVSDLREREFWDDYQDAYEDALSATSTEWAPWYVIPADHKWIARTMVADILSRSILGLDLKFPVVTDEQLKALEAARKTLESE